MKEKDTKNNENIYFMPSLDVTQIEDKNYCLNKYIIEERKSKFYSFAYYIEDKVAVNRIIDILKKEYSDASHLVFAYRLKNDAKYSDDKEPKNTAGKPIYDILEKRNLVNILVIVIRYFGGTLLGTGLLTRTYLNAGIKVIENIKLENYSEFEIQEHIIDYKDIGSMLKKLEQEKAIIIDIKRAEKVYIKVKEKKTKQG